VSTSPHGQQPLEKSTRVVSKQKPTMVFPSLDPRQCRSCGPTVGGGYQLAALASLKNTPSLPTETSTVPPGQYGETVAQLTRDKDAREDVV
jgi:hypothetical protein